MDWRLDCEVYGRSSLNINPSTGYRVSTKPLIREIEVQDREIIGRFAFCKFPTALP
jgi:hypothetical protein